VPDWNEKFVLEALISLKNNDANIPYKKLNESLETKCTIHLFYVSSQYWCKETEGINQQGFRFIAKGFLNCPIKDFHSS
jgi:hypothetical protein